MDSRCFYNMSFGSGLKTSYGISHFLLKIFSRENIFLVVFGKLKIFFDKTYKVVVYLFDDFFLTKRIY